MDGQIGHQAEKLIASFGISYVELFKTLGISSSATKRGADDSASKKLNAVVEILFRLESWFDSPSDFWDWFISRPISGFGGKAPADIIRQYDTQGVDALILFIESKKAGGFD